MDERNEWKRNMSEYHIPYGRCCDSCYWYEPRGAGATWGLCLSTAACMATHAADQCVLATDGAECPGWQSLAHFVQGARLPLQE